MSGKLLDLTTRWLVGSILATCLLSAASFARASDVPLVDDFWTRSQMENRPGSGVWRFDLDLDGDGQPEILLANQENGGKHGDMEWQVYKCVKGSRYRFLGTLSFSRSGFQVLQGPARVEALWFSDEHDRDASGHTVRSADLGTFLVAETGITQTSTRPLKEEDIETKLAQMDSWHEAAKPLLLAALLDKEGKFVNPTWYDLETGKPAVGVTNLEELVVDPSLSWEKTTSAAEWNEQGLKLIQQKKYDMAVLDFRNANSIAGSKNALYANNLGFALYKVQWYEEAVEWLKKAIAIDRNRAVAYLNLGDALVKLNRDAEARDAYTKYLELAPNSKSASEVAKKLELLSPSGQAADQSLLDHFVSMLEIPSESAVPGSMPIEVFRMELDVTGAGNRELFLGTNWGVGRTGMTWVAYTRQANGRYRPRGVIYFHYTDFYYSSNGLFLCSLIHVPHSDGPAFVYYRIANDAIQEITDDESFRPPSEPLAKLNAWQKQGRPPVYVDTLADLKTSATPQWKDADTRSVVPSVGKLDAKVTETGGCSAEKFMDVYSGDDGCTPPNRRHFR